MPPNSKIKFKRENSMNSVLKPTKFYLISEETKNIGTSTVSAGRRIWHTVSVGATETPLKTEKNNH